MNDDLERAFAFMRRGDIAGSRTERSRLGTAVFDDRLPTRWDSNYLLVERECSSDELAAELANRRRRMAIVPDEPLGARLADALRPRGWRIDRHVVMIHRREPHRSADLSHVREVGHEALRPLRTRAILGQPWGNGETARILLEAKPLIAERLTARFFAVYEGNAVVSYTDLYLDGDEAQIEDVGTAAEHRGKGHATAVVLRALDEARRAGASFVFLVADDEDWPKEWYAKLGFDTAGRYYKLVRPG